MSLPFRKPLALLCLACFLLLLPLSLFADEDELNDPLAKGKAALDRGDHYIAAVLLTSALQLHPVVGDYALFWRARAYDARGEYSDALADLAELRNRYPVSLLVQRARKKEAEIALVVKSPLLPGILKEYVRDYPSDLDVMLKYAYLLRQGGNISEAKKLFREIYLSSSALSDKALAALEPADITQADLYKRGQNLNNAWMFRESEKVFREALNRDGRELRGRIREGLAYSLFRQKRYPEAADLYGQSGNAYWRARSLLRAGQVKTFEEELTRLTRSKDSRIASVLINYASRKRRDGDIDAAVRILSDVISRYPASREEALWTLGWTYYRAGRHLKAGEVFARLSSQYKDTKYGYWAARCTKKPGTSAGVSGAAAQKPRIRDFYYYISAMQDSAKDSPLRKVSAKRIPSGPLSERIDLLRRLGLRAEAAAEIRHLSGKAGGSPDPIALSAALNELGEYHASVGLIAKAPYAEDLHGLYYPRGYWEEIEEAARRYSLDPPLIAAVIREESRFDRRARSIAGALGLMQLMPETAKMINRPADSPMRSADDLFQPRTNITLGSYYLRHLIETFGSLAPAIAAYNAGEEVVKIWIDKGEYEDADEFIEDIPYDETKNYVKKVLVSFFEYLRSAESIDIPRVRRLVGEL